MFRLLINFISAIFALVMGAVVLIGSFLIALILVPTTLIFGYKAAKEAEVSDADYERILREMDNELNGVICRTCMKDGNIRYTPLPNRSIRSENTACAFCRGKGMLYTYSD